MSDKFIDARTETDKLKARIEALEGDRDTLSKRINDLEFSLEATDNILKAFIDMMANI